MALGSRSEKYVFFGLWAAFGSFVVLYWHAISSAGSLITEIETLNGRIAEVNATLDEMRYEIRGSGGCTVQLQDLKTQKVDMEAKVAAHPKALEEKTAAFTKADANLKTITEENTKAKAAVKDVQVKLDVCNSTCIERIQNTSLLCTTASPVKLAEKGGFLGKLFGNK